MNWSSKWPDKPKSEAEKVYEDAARFGTGYSFDGKHVPAEDVIVSHPKSNEINKIFEDTASGPTPEMLGVDLATTTDKTIITIREGHKSYSFEPTIIGDLALDYSDEGWNVYHVPTLQLCSKLVPGFWGEDSQQHYEYEKDALLRWMAKVQTNYQTAWTMLRCLTPENYESKAQSAKDIILEWCLSVKVE